MFNRMILRIITLLSEEFSLSLINQRAAASWCDSTEHPNTYSSV